MGMRARVGTFRGVTAVLPGLLVVVVAAGGATLLPSAAADPEGGMTLETTSLEETRPVVGPIDEETDFWARRLAERGPERFSLERSFAAEMLAFRAYGEQARLDEARERLEALEEHHARGPATLSARSGWALARHDFEAALESALAYRELSSSDAAKWRLFDALWAVGDQEQAMRQLGSSVDTTAIGTLSRRARVLDAQGEVERARDLFRRVVTLTEAYAEPAPVRAWALAELGHFELHSGTPPNAVRRYRESLVVLPGNPAALEGLAAVAEGVDRDLDRAAELLRLAVRNGAHLDAALRLADLEEATGHLEEAEALRADFLDRVTRDDDVRWANLRPLAALLSEDPARLADAERAARDDLGQRQDPGAFMTLAWVLHRQGDPSMAWLLAERALAGGAPPPPLAYQAGVIGTAVGAPEAAGLLSEALDGRVELSVAEEEHAKALLGVETP